MDPTDNSQTSNVNEIYQDFLKKLAELIAERNIIVTDFVKKIEELEIEHIRSSFN
jgi:hypothetical protein